MSNSISSTTKRKLDDDEEISKLQKLDIITTHIPDEIWLEIAKYLPFKTMQSMCLTHKHMMNLKWSFAFQDRTPSEIYFLDPEYDDECIHLRDQQLKILKHLDVILSNKLLKSFIQHWVNSHYLKDDGNLNVWITHFGSIKVHGNIFYSHYGPEVTTFIKGIYTELIYAAGWKFKPKIVKISLRWKDDYNKMTGTFPFVETLSIVFDRDNRPDDPLIEYQLKWIAERFPNITTLRVKIRRYHVLQFECFLSFTKLENLFVNFDTHYTIRLYLILERIVQLKKRINRIKVCFPNVIDPITSSELWQGINGRKYHRYHNSEMGIATITTQRQ